MNRILTASLVPLPSVLSAAAYAHGVHGTAASSSAGFAHPFMGPDHAFAMIAIGVVASALLQAVGAALARILERDVRLTAVPLTAAGAWILIASMM